MLATTKDQKFKANLIRTILDYEVRQQERAETNKAARRKRAENTELAELRSKVAELTAHPVSANNSRAEEISDLRACLKETDGISPRAFAFLGGVQVVVGSLTDRFSVRILVKNRARPNVRAPESLRGDSAAVKIPALNLRYCAEFGGYLSITAACRRKVTIKPKARFPWRNSPFA